MLCPGQVYETTVTVQNIPGPPAAATLTVTKPDGTTEAHSGPWTWTQAGSNYTAAYDYLLAAPGIHRFAWVTTNPGTAPTPVTENVRDYASALSMNEIKDHLNITGTRDDDELGEFLMAATEMLEAKCGILVPRQFTTRVDEGRYRLVLDTRPVISVASVTSVWPGGPQWLTAQLRWDADAGIVDQISPFPFYWGPWDVVLTAGRPVIAERILYAGKEQVRHMWETQRGSMPPALLQGEEEFTTTTGFTFTIPRRVLEALEADIMPAI